MSNARAKAGGEVGTNGEWYEGGKFLPSTTAPKRAGRSTRGTGRMLVAPGVWEVRPEGMSAIFARLQHFMDGDVLHKTGEAVISPRFDDRHPAVIAYSNGMDQLRTLAARYNAGERWFKP